MLKELIIKVDNQAVYLSKDLKIPIQQTNIPNEHCTFRTHEDIFWTVELIEYNQETRCWRVKVIDYFTSENNNFNRQTSTKKVARIAFEKFDWPKFEEHLSTYQKIKLLNILNNHDTQRFFREESKQISDPTFSIEDIQHQLIDENVRKEPNTNDLIITAVPSPLIKKYNLEFNVKFSDATIKLGHIAFKKSIQELNCEVNFKIDNDYLLEEFENIKSWFAMKLKTKKFKVYATITTTDGEISETIASSPQVELINAELVDNIKYNRTIALTRIKKGSVIDKSLFTAEEIFGELETEDQEGNVFHQNEQDILNYLFSHHQTRNRKHLEYLSGSRQSEKIKLKFTLNPHFGFLFFIEGRENNHFVWELLNSHATYIWSTDKSELAAKLQYKRIEESIYTIRENGREQYKRAYRKNNIDNDLVFSVIEHKNIGSNLVDGFVKWKHNLNVKIT